MTSAFVMFGYPFDYKQLDEVWTGYVYRKKEFEDIELSKEGRKVGTQVMYFDHDDYGGSYGIFLGGVDKDEKGDTEVIDQALLKTVLGLKDSLRTDAAVIFNKDLGEPKLFIKYLVG